MAYVAYSARISSQSAKNCSINMLDSSFPAICSEGEKTASGSLDKMGYFPSYTGVFGRAGFSPEKSKHFFVA